MAKRGRPRSKITREQFFRNEWRKSFRFYQDFVIKDYLREHPKPQDKQLREMNKSDLFLRGFYMGMELGAKIYESAFELFVKDALRHSLSVSKAARPLLRMLTHEDERVREFAREHLKEFPNDILGKLRRPMFPQFPRKTVVRLRRILKEKGPMTYLEIAKEMKLPENEVYALVWDAGRQRMPISCVVLEKKEKFLPPD